ncbi:MAG TPA: hypothetical protein VFL43_19555 [Variovorax sp.]|nr:hypothetical protein [Variovorax sp.]
MSDDPELNPSRDRRSGPGTLRLFAGLVVAPLAWALQMLIGYGLAAHACYPGDVALESPLWTDLRAIVGTLSAALWVLLLAGCAIAWWNWKTTRPHSDAGADKIIQSGAGRPRFMALCGVMVSGLFAIVLLFTSMGILWVPSCGP